MNKNNILIEETESTPEVFLDYENKTLTLNGVSIPENPYIFYAQIYDIIEKLSIEELIVNIKLKYLNSSSYKTILMLFCKIQQKIKQPTINWHYEDDDEDIKEVVGDVENLIKLKINRINIQEVDS